MADKYIINTMLSKEPFEESLTLDNYFQISKKESLQMKRQRKESDVIRKAERKHSTQLSIFGWLNQSHLNQKSLMYLYFYSD
jgi:hypothetical protein